LKSMEIRKQRGGYQMKVKDRTELLNRQELAQALNMSSTTLWRVIRSNQAFARKNKLKNCPIHQNYAGGRKYYLADEVEKWFDYLESCK
jgi:Mor family transcriptional regulator